MGMLSLQKLLKSHSRLASCACRLSTLPEYYLFTGNSRQARHWGAEAALWPHVVYIIVTDPDNRKNIRVGVEQLDLRSPPD